MTTEAELTKWAAEAAEVKQVASQGLNPTVSDLIAAARIETLIAELRELRGAGREFLAAMADVAKIKDMTRDERLPQGLITKSMREDYMKKRDRLAALINETEPKGATK